jgi:hypothetical protein
VKIEKVELFMSAEEWGAVRENARALGGDDFAALIALAERFNRKGAPPNEHALSRCLVLLAGAAATGRCMGDVYTDASLAIGGLVTLSRRGAGGVS